MIIEMSTFKLKAYFGEPGSVCYLGEPNDEYISSYKYSILLVHALPGDLYSIFKVYIQKSNTRSNLINVYYFLVLALNRDGHVFYVMIS